MKRIKGEVDMTDTDYLYRYFLNNSRRNNKRKPMLKNRKNHGAKQLKNKREGGKTNE